MHTILHQGDGSTQTIHKSRQDTQRGFSGPLLLMDCPRVIPPYDERRELREAYESPYLSPGDHLDCYIEIRRQQIIVHRPNFLGSIEIRHMAVWWAFRNAYHIARLALYCQPGRPAVIDGEKMIGILSINETSITMEAVLKGARIT